MRKNTDYRSISCQLYDHLELWSMRKTICEIRYLDNKEKSLVIKGVITKLFTKDKIEYLTLDETKTIQLDHIIKINNMKNEGQCKF